MKNYVITWNMLSHGCTNTWERTIYVKAQTRFEAFLKSYRIAIIDLYNCSIHSLKYLVNLSGPADE